MSAVLNLRPTFRGNGGKQIFVVRCIALALLLATVVAFFCVYMYKRIESELIGSYQKNLDSGMALLSNQVATLKRMVMFSSSSTILDEIAMLNSISAPIKPRYYVYANKVKKYIDTVTNSNELLFDLILSFKSSGLIISRYGIFQAADRFESFYNIGNDEIFNCLNSGERFTGSLLILPGTRIEIPYAYKSSDTAFTYVLPMDMVTHKALALLVFDCAQLSTVFSSDIIDNGQISLFRADGTLLTVLGMAEQPLTGGVQINVTDADTGLTARALISPSFILRLLSPFLYTIISFSLAVLAAGISLNVNMSLRIRKLVKSLMASMRNLGMVPQNQRESFSFLSDSVSLLLRDAQRNDMMITLYREALQSRVIDCYLQHQGMCVPEHEEHGLLESFPDSYVLCYALMDVHAEEHSSQIDGAIEIVIGKKLQASLQSNTILHVMSGHSFILIIPARSLTDIIITKLAELVDGVNDTLSAALCITLSHPMSDIAKLNIAYEQARSSMTTLRKRPGLHLPGEDTLLRSIPVQAGETLYQAVQSGDSAKAIATLRGIMLENAFSDVEQSYYYARMHISMAAYDVFGTKWNESATIPKYSAQLPPSDAIHVLESAVKALCERICQGAQEKKTDSMTSEMLDIMRRRFSEYDLNGAMIAETLGITEKCLNALCRSATGLHVSSYIHRLRLENASSMLRNTDCAVRQICADSGYNTLNAFYKAFKRVYGKTPSEYRENFRHGL